MKLAILVLTGALFAAAAAPAHALQTPHAGRADARVRTVDYDPAQVVRLAARPRIATQVAFGTDETIQHVAVGDSGHWDVAAEGRLLFLKPKGAGAATNLIVTTEGPDGSRTYLFELSAAARGRPDYALRFRYPADARARAASAVAQAAAGLDRGIINLRLAAGAVEGPHNLAYSLLGPADLAPSEVSDNGRFTVLRFAEAQPLPAISTVAADGTEALARPDVRGSFVVLPGTYPGLRLRKGREVVCIFNDAWRPDGRATGTLTATREVVRTAKGDRP